MKTVGVGQTPRAQRGPRGAGDPDSREAIAAAARECFTEHGYAQTSLREVARRAGVDVALVTYYFRGKSALFQEAMQLPMNPREVLAMAEGVDPEQLGETLTRAVLMAWSKTEVGTAVRGMLQLLVTQAQAWTMIREFWADEIIATLAHLLPSEDATYRAGLAVSQLTGLVMLREVVAAEPLTAADLETVIHHVAPTVQRYLTGPLAD